jgi:hypothetical protein
MIGAAVTGEISSPRQPGIQDPCIATVHNHLQFRDISLYTGQGHDIELDSVTGQFLSGDNDIALGHGRGCSRRLDRSSGQGGAGWRGWEIENDEGKDKDGYYKNADDNQGP